MCIRDRERRVETNGGDLVRGVSVTDVRRAERQTETLGPPLGDPNLLPADHASDVVVLDAHKVPDEQAHRIVRRARSSPDSPSSRAPTPSLDLVEAMAQQVGRTHGGLQLIDPGAPPEAPPAEQTSRHAAAVAARSGSGFAGHASPLGGRVPSTR